MTASGHNDAYTAFSEGMRLLADGNAHAAVIALEQARELEPAKGSVRETLARAYYRTGRFAAAEEEFTPTLEIEPVNDYAQFGVGLCRLRAGDRARARGHLRLATVMRPDNADYQRRARAGHRDRGAGRPTTATPTAGRRRRPSRRERRGRGQPSGRVLRPGRCGLARRDADPGLGRGRRARCAAAGLRVVFLTNNSSGPGARQRRAARGGGGRRPSPTTS